MALEPRLMFDGVGLAGVDPTRAPVADAPAVEHPTSARLGANDAHRITAPVDTLRHTPSPPLAELFVIDPSVSDLDTLRAGLREGAEIVVLDPAEDGLAQIAAAVAERAGSISALHVISHGAAGQITLGSRTIDAAALSQYQGALTQIGAGLTVDADILLYGCDVGDGWQGMAFLQAIAAATGADVAASIDPTGAARLGGDWVLEASVGTIEASIAMRGDAAAGWAHLLVNSPTVALSTARTDVLLGESFQIVATFDNAGTDPGFGPYIDLFVPSRGADGGGAPDGVTITGASYLGQVLTVTQIVLTQSDVDAGTVAHPYARDTLGGNRVAIPGGFVAGDRLVVVELPFGSYSADQPLAAIAIDAVLSPLADVGTPLQVLARAGFRYGGDPLDNPAVDPTTQSGTVALTVAPTLYRLTTTYIGSEDETATGPNYQRAYRVDVDIAAGQTLSAVDLSTVLDPGMQFTPISGTPSAIGGTSLGTAPAGGWTNAAGVLVSTIASGTSGPGTPGGTIARTVAGVTGTSGAIDLSMVVGFHVPERDAGLAPVLDAASGDATTLVLGTALSAGWTPLDTRDAPGPVSTTVTDAHRLEAHSIAIQKVAAVEFDARAPGLTPVDELRYTLDVQVSDFFAFGGSSAAATPLRIVDTLSDGLEMVDTTSGPFADPVLTVVRSGAAAEVYTLARGVHYSIVTEADGRQTVVFDLRAALPGGAGQLLVGDLFAGDTVQTGATTLRLTFSARVLEQYRVAPPDLTGSPAAGSAQRELNEGDRLVNNAVVTGAVLGASLDPAAPGLSLQNEDTRVSDRIAGNAVSIVIWGRNGENVTSDPANPVRVTPGDTVSYVMTYTVPTGDFEQFGLTAYLPLPIFDATDPDGDGTPSAFTQMAGPYYAKPPTGQFSFEAVGGDGAGVPVPVVTALPNANGLQFFFGDRSDATDTPVTIRVAFTVTASDQPFVDGLFLTAQAQADGTSTASEPLLSQSIDRLRRTEPQLALYKGVVQDDVDDGTSVFDPVFSTGATDALMRPAGNTSADPRAALITDAQVATLDADVREVDAGDTLRFAIVVQNLGQSARGAFDLTIRDQLPPGIDPGSVANLRLTLGDGQLIYDGTPGTLAGLVRGDGSPIATEADAIAALLGGTGLQLVDDVGLDGIAGTADDVGAIGGTLDRNGVATSPGSNVLIISYDARLLPGVEAGSSRTASAALVNYAGTEGGADFTPTDLTDAATIVIALPVLDKVIVGTSEPDATTAGTDVVIGERVTYTVTLAVPEGTVSGTQFTDTLEPGLSFVSIDAIVASPGLSFSGGLPLPGAVVPTASGGDANRITIPFGTITNTNTDNAATETVSVTYTAVVANVAGNRQGTLQNNGVQLAAASATVSDAAPDVRVVEPSLTVALTPSTMQPDAGDVVGYVLTIAAAAGRPPAFDVALDVANLLPAGLVYEPGTLLQTAGPVATSLAFGGSGIVGAWASLDAGARIVLAFDARVTEAAGIGDVFDQDATVRFSSLPGAGNTDLSPLATLGDFERTGATTDPGGALNDYRAIDDAPVTVATQVPVLTLVATSEPGSPAATVVPGEVLRFRMVVQVPEGTASGAEMVPTLPAGLRFVNDGSVTVAFVANGGGAGIDSTTIAGGALDATGGGADASAITAVLPTQVLPGTAIVDALGAAIPADTVMAAGTAPRIILGDLVNGDRDADKEFVVVEFNAIVDNAAAGSAGALGDVVFDWRTGGASRGLSGPVATTLGEPSIVDLDKRVVAVTGAQVTFEVVFTNTGTQTAHDLRLIDDFAGATNLGFAGPGSVTGLPPGATNVSDADTFEVAVPSLAAGASVSIRYVATVTDLDLPVPARDAVVTYTSLSAGGLSLTTPTSAGNVSTPTTGERTGDTADYGASVNMYRDADPAGLGKLYGRLWDDTAAADGVIGAGEARLNGVLVRLDHAGLDGVFGSGDDFAFTSLTDPTGYYGFGALPEGNVRIVAPAVIANANGSLGEVRARFDVQGVQTDATIALTVAGGVLYPDRNIGYVQQNDAPTVTVPGAQIVDEDTPLPIAGISVADPDPDAGASTAPTVTLTVGAGSLVLTPAAGVGATGIGSQAVVLTGPIADLNATLATLVYQGAADASGPDLLTVRIDDRGNTGDADGDGVPGEPLDDNLFAQRTVSITVVAVNDAPVALPDARTITEDQTIADGDAIDGSPGGDVADTDVEGDPLNVVGVAAGVASGPIAGGFGVPIVTPLGSLTLQADGTYTYQPSVDLRAGQSVQDVFSYTVSDPGGALSTTTITITITGLNDPPLAVADTNRVLADAAGTAIGNVVAGGVATDRPDLDPDAGDVLTVRGVAAGTVVGPLAAAVGVPVAGLHGSLTIGPDGTYTYRVDPTDAAVLALRPGQTLTDTFTYTIGDIAGATSTTTLTITIDGFDDPPRAQPDVNRVPAPGTVAATGNVIGGGSAGDRPDLDPDGDVLQVQGVRVGGDTGTPVATGTGAPVPGQWGSLVLNPDGTYAYTVDAARPEVLALRPGETLTEVFTYTVRDPSGQVATTALTITIDGVNEPPVAGSVSQVIDQEQPAGVPPPSVLPPTVTDLDNSPTELTVRVDAIGLPESGTFLRPDGTPVRPGEALTVADLQALRFQPTPGYAATPSADGTLPGGTLAFTVTDPSGGSAPGSISIALRPTVPAPAPAPAPPPASSSTPPLLALTTGSVGGGGTSGAAADAPLSSFFDASPLGRPLSAAPPARLGDTGVSPVAGTVTAVAGASAVAAGLVPSEAAMLQPYGFGPLAAPPGLDDVPGDYVRQAVAEAREAMLSDRARLDADSGRLDLDAGGLFPSNRVDGLFGEERIGPTRDWNPLLPAPPPPVEPVVAVAAGAAAPAEPALKVDDDCEPPPKPKPKPVKRILPDAAVRPAPSFSEQLDVQKKKFRPPAKVVPKTPPARQC
jgi:fimbrial isopeptide formation D2 family protein/uncharacterized repeat protein (TIGR01451 family)